MYATISWETKRSFREIYAWNPLRGDSVGFHASQLTIPRVVPLFVMDLPALYLQTAKLVLFFFLIYVLFAILIKILKKKRTKNQPISNWPPVNPFKSQSLIEKPIRLPYGLRRTLFTQTEAKFFNELLTALREHNVLIFTKVRLADLVYVQNQHKNWGYWNKINSKHIDFVICDLDSKPLLCIELDGYSHQFKNAIKNDAFKDELFKQLDIDLLRVSVSGGYEFSVIVDRLGGTKT